MKTIKFSRNYSKLNGSIFTTLRRYADYPQEGSTVIIKTPSKTFEAVILMKARRKLSDISSALLIYDTGKNNRNEAFRLFNTFYRNPVKMDETFTILLLQKKKPTQMMLK